MRYRFVDRYGWERWQEVERPADVIKVVNERAMAPPPLVTDAPSRSVALHEMVFVAQTWRFDDFRETVYVEDDRRLDDRDRGALPSDRREHRLERQYLDLYHAVKKIVDGAAGGHPLAEMFAGREAIVQLEDVLRTHDPRRRNGE